MTADSREITISYGSLNVGAGTYQLHGIHTFDLDEESFRCSFDVVVTGDTVDDVQGAENTLRTYVRVQNADFKIVYTSTNIVAFTDGAAASPTSGAVFEEAQSITASYELLGTHRTYLTRAYRITVSVVRSAQRSGKEGVRTQSIRTTTLPNGLRTMSYLAEYTPGYSAATSGTAEERYEDGTVGFAARVAAIQTALTGTWEQSTPLRTTYDEDKRTYVASAAYRELIFAQSATATNDTELFGASYDVVVNRSQAFGIPGSTNVQPFTACTVVFSSAVVTTQTDISSVIDAKILPYCKATVSRKLRLSAEPITMRHTLRADPIDNRVSGTVDYLVIENTILEVSKRIADIARNGDTYVPVLDGTRWTRDKHTGPGAWTRRVVIATRVEGLNAGAALDEIEATERSEAESSGFKFTGWSVQSSPSVEVFKEDGETITTTVQTRVLEFERADARSKIGAGDSQPPSENSGAGGAGSGFEERT